MGMRFPTRSIILRRSGLKSAFLKLEYCTVEPRLDTRAIKDRRERRAAGEHEKGNETTTAGSPTLDLEP